MRKAGDVGVVGVGSSLGGGGKCPSCEWRASTVPELIVLSAIPDALVVSEWIVRCLEVETRVAGSATWERPGPDMDSSGSSSTLSTQKREKFAKDVQFSV